MPPVVKSTVLPSLPCKVNELLATKVFPSATVNVAPVAGAVIANLFMDVALAIPKIGVTNVGALLNTNDPEPVSSLIKEFSSALLVVAN